MTRLKMLNVIWQLISAKPKVTFSAIAAITALVLSLSFSEVLFMKLLGYSFGIDWNPWHFLRNAPEALANPEIRSHWIFALILPLAGVLAFIVFSVKNTQSALFGNAHWATYFEAKRSGILGSDGLILGKKWGKYLRVDGFEHVFVFAPTGSGKTTSLVTTNLLTWSDSCIVQDIKMTLFEETSAYRAKYGHQCFLWNPGSRDGKTHAYNPIDAVSKNPLLRVDDLQKIANILIPDNQHDPLWTSAPRQLFVALQLYLLDTPNIFKTLGEMVRLVKNTPSFQNWASDTASKSFEAIFEKPEAIKSGCFYVYIHKQKMHCAFIHKNDTLETAMTHAFKEKYPHIQTALQTHKTLPLETVNVLMRDFIQQGLLEKGSQALDPLCRRNFFQFLQNDYKLQSSILQSFLSYFELFDNPLIDSATAHSDFDITQLKVKRMTIYVAAGSDNLSRLSPLLTVFYQQAMDNMLRKVPNLKEEPYGVALLIDEFSALKRMDVFQKSIGLMREYRVRVMAIIQDLPQLYVTYGRDGAKAFINSKYRVAFAQNDWESAQLISGWLGTTTAQQKSHNFRAGGSFLNDSETISVTKKPLMSPDDVMKLKRENMIIVIEGASPILAKKNFWYNDPIIKPRMIGSIRVPHLIAKIVSFDQEGARAYFKEAQNNKSVNAVAVLDGALDNEIEAV